MSKHKRSENSYINNDIIPTLHHLYGYPIHDPEKVLINDVPILRPSGGRSGSTIDIAYYHKGEPLLIVEAKTNHKTHEYALNEVLNYLRNFPKDPKHEFTKSGKRPKYLSTTVGKEIKFYKWKYNDEFEDYIAIEIQDLSYNELLKKYGLSKGYKARKLEAIEFKSDLFDELIDIFRVKNGKITKDTIERIVQLLFNYLNFGDRFTQHFPYFKLSAQKKEWVLDLFRRFDFIKSLSPELAKEFRKCVTRAFQGDEFNQYITDQSIIEFMCALVGKQKPSSKILDFECGSGGFLAEEVSMWKLSLRSIKGIDIAELPYLVSKTYLAIYFKKKGENVDTIPVSKDNGLFFHGNKYDLIIGNPAGSYEYKHGNEGRILKEGLKHLMNNEGAFKEYDLSVQQAIRSCKNGGKICLILPDGLFSNSRDHYLRKLVSDNCKIKAIVSLPKGAFKRGHDTRIQGKGASVASMKMTVLYCEKYSASKKKSTNNYPVFLASILDPPSTKGEISEWIKQPFDFVKEQFLYWQKHNKLKKYK